MTKRFDRKRNRRAEPASVNDLTVCTDDLTREKQRARILKHSPWWKKKTSTGICYYCRRSFNPYDLTMDHIIPLSRGGRSERINLVAACKECNNKKKCLLPAEWDEYLRSLEQAEIR